MALTLPSIFNHHMVLQRDMTIPVWGWDEPGSAVCVSIGEANAKALTDAQGVWRVTLPAFPAGGPLTMTITGSSTITFTDVMVGEVWLCSGQSNMEFPVAGAQNGEEEVANANYPNIRLFNAQKTVALTPQIDVVGDWQRCSPHTVQAFSAVGYFFARSLYQALKDIPIGVINSSWGGTVAEAWTSREGLLAEPDLCDIVRQYDILTPEFRQLTDEYLLKLATWAESNFPKDQGNSGLARGWAALETDTADWQPYEVPQLWQHSGHDISGVFWFRKKITIPVEWVGHDLALSLGSIDKSDWTYINGTQVGGMSIYENDLAWSTPRKYTVPASLVKPGENLLAVRIFSHVYAGGFWGPAQQMTIQPIDLPDATPISLAGTWQYAIEQNYGKILPDASSIPQPWGDSNPNTPMALSHGMIDPLLPFALRGAIWYQGESNAYNPTQYQILFPAMINDWRRRWQQGDFSFYYVQLANYTLGEGDPAKGNWAALREAQLRTLALPHTGMAVITDIGNPTDIHPTNKQDVGHRLALIALANDYGRTELEFSGPLYREARVEGSAMRIFFDHADSGLTMHDNTLAGFIIAGADQHFLPAIARIDGQSIVVSNPMITTPVAVRYAWEDNPPCSLYNEDGLPASPFRTDNWCD